MNPPATQQLVAAKLRRFARALLILTLIIIVRLFYLQVETGHTFAALSTRNFTRTEAITCPRGSIFDATGSILATNRPIINVYWHGTGNRQLSPAQKEALQAACKLVGRDADDEILWQKIGAAERRNQKHLLARDLSFEQLSLLAEQLGDNVNISMQTDFKRYYPHESVAAHIVGYLTQMASGHAGRMGLEKLLEPTLHGSQGTVLHTINSFGRHLHEEQIEQVMRGNDIYTTLDLPLQLLAERLFPTEYAGCMLIMNPRHGDIKAIVSRPTFDPSMFLDPINQQTWQELLETQPFLNRCFDASYPPASIFKLVTVSAALEEGLITPDTQVVCKGFVISGDRKMYCARRYGHGPLSVQESLAKSCNILFYEIAQHMKIDTLAEYAFRYGLGVKTDMLFPENAGLVPTADWKRQTKGERWWPGETLSAAIGQSYLLTSPIQIACMIGSIFEGYLVTPRVLMNESYGRTPLHISRPTREFLQQSMKCVIKQGTGRRIGSIEDLNVYAKTGTAQTSSWSKRTHGKEFLEHVWFVTYFYYLDHEPLVMVILLEHAGNARDVLTLAKKFLLEYRLLEQKRSTP